MLLDGEKSLSVLYAVEAYIKSTVTRKMEHQIHVWALNKCFDKKFSGLKGGRFYIQKEIPLAKYMKMFEAVSRILYTSLDEYPCNVNVPIINLFTIFFSVNELDG